MVADPAQPDDAPTEDPVEKLLFECLESNDPEAAIEAAAADHPSLADELRRAYAEMAHFDLIGDATAPRSSPEQVPEKLGEYRLLERLGAGGMGVVYLARDDVLQRTVALKLIRPEHLYLPGARERFQREVETIARLQHAGIVPIYGVGKADGMPYFTMQHIGGCSLSQALTELQQQETAPDGRALTRVAAAGSERVDAHGSGSRSGSRSGSNSGSGSSTHGIDGLSWPDTCVAIATEIAAALHHAHERGVLHRDVKPSNILLSADCRPMIVDFGLAWADDTDQRLTRSTSQLGSLPYLPPEHITGDTPDPNRATDVYSLGVTLYEMLTLRNPFLGKNGEETRRNILGARALRLRREQRGVSWELETVCMKALDPDPSKRYRTMLDFQRDLERVRNRQTIEARRPGVLRRTRRWTQRHPTVMVAFAVALVVSIVALVAFGVQQRDQRVQSDNLRETAEIERYSALVSSADVEMRASGRPARARLQLSQCREQDRGWEWLQLEYATDQSLSVNSELAGPVQDLLWHPDGDRYVACTQERELVCYTRDQQQVWRHQGQPISSFVFRAVDGGHELIAGMLGALIEVRDAANGVRTGTYERPADALAGELTSLAITADGNRVFSTCSDGSVSVWDARERRFVETFGHHDAQAHCLALSSDGSRLATGGFDNMVRVFDTKTLEEVASWRMGRWVLDLFFSPDGASVCATDGLFLYAKTIAEADEAPRVLDRNARTVLASKISPDGKWVAISATRRKLQIYRVAQQQPFRIERYAQLLGHEGLLQHLTFASDSRHLLSGSTDQTVRIWDPMRSAETGARPHRRLVQELVFVGDGACISGDSMGNLCATDDDGQITRLEAIEGQAAHGNAVSALLYRDGQLTSIDEGGRVILWHRADGSWQPTTTIELETQVTTAQRLDDGRLAMATGDGQLVVLGDDRSAWRAHDAHITSLVVHGNRAWTACVDGHLKRWDLETGALDATGPTHPEWIASMTIAPDGSWIATGCADTIIRILDAETFALRHELEGHARVPMAMVTDTDGARLISGGGFDAELRFWTPDTGRCLVSQGRPDAVLSLAFDPETLSLALGGRVGHVRRLRTRPGGPRSYVRRATPVDRITSPPGQPSHR
jgi:serine/threonine protein kinase/WD40 repeat protein